MRRIPIIPADRFRRFVVMPDISSNLAREIWHGRKDPAREEITLDLGEPEFDLVQPGRVGRREVHVHLGMRNQKRPNGLRFMGRQIVGNHVNLSPLGLTGHNLAEKLDERRAGMPRHGLAEHLARLRVERGKQREGAVPVIFKAMPFGAAWR